MTERLNLEVISSVAFSGIRFDLLTNNSLKNIYLDGAQVGKYLERILHRTNYPIRIYSAEVKRMGEVETIDVVRAESVADCIPKELLEITRQKYPAKAEKIEPPKLIFTTKVDGKDFNIWRGECNLVNLDDLSNGICSGCNGKFIFAACKYYLYTDGETFYIDLRDAAPLLGAVASRSYPEIAEDINDFRARLNGQVFMEIPRSGIEGDISATLFEEVQSPFGTFEIYKGIGFAENAFFAAVRDLETLLTQDNHEDAFNDAIDEVGYVITGTRIFCRLDDAPKFVHKYLSLIWDGENQFNKNIRRGWQFYRWLKDFIPAFFDKHVEYRANSHPRYYIYPEENEMPNMREICDAVDKFARDAESFKQELMRYDDND